MSELLQIDLEEQENTSSATDLRVVNYKTRICMYWASWRGCQRTDCTFAHGEADLRPRKDFTGTKICGYGMHCQKEECRYLHPCGSGGGPEGLGPAPSGHGGPQGGFGGGAAQTEGAILAGVAAPSWASDRQEPSTVSAFPPPATLVAGPGVGRASMAALPKKRPRCSLRKTKLCSHYHAGECKKGNACDYAHGEQELRARRRRTAWQAWQPDELVTEPAPQHGAETWQTRGMPVAEPLPILLQRTTGLASRAVSVEGELCGPPTKPFAALVASQGRRIVSKNTFFDEIFDGPESLGQGDRSFRRCASAPAFPWHQQDESSN